MGGSPTTLAAVRDDIAKSTGAGYRDKINVASLSADVSSVLGVDFPNLSFVAAVVGTKEKAVVQLVSRGGAKHVFVHGESMCLRHGCRCSLRDSGPIDVLVADGVEDMDQLVAALKVPASASSGMRSKPWDRASGLGEGAGSKVGGAPHCARVGALRAEVAAVSFTQPRVVAVIVEAAARVTVTDEGLKKALGSGWEASSLNKREGSMGLPLRGEIAVHFLRQAGDTDPSQFLSAFLAAGVVPMEELLKSVDPGREEGLELLWPKKTKTQTPEPEKSVIAELAKSGHLPLSESDLAPYSFPSSMWAELSKAQKRRAVLLLAWAVRSAAGESACCDLDAVRGPINLGGALPDTRGLKMFIAPSLERGRQAVFVKMSPYHILAARGFPQPGRINLAMLGPQRAQRAAEAAMPTTTAMGCILAAMRVKNISGRRAHRTE